jgi:hypothetical protein
MGDVDLRQRAEDVPLGVTLRIMSAPAAFALPMVQRKPFKPAFQVCTEWPVSPKYLHRIVAQGSA